MQSFPVRFVLIVVLMLALQSLSLAAAPETQNGGLPDTGSEMLLFQDIPSVFSASKYEQKVTEAPAAVSIVTSDEIRKYGYRTLADLLQSLRSFHVTFNRNTQLLGVRGFGRPGDTNSRILLLINGHRVNDNIFEAATVGAGFLLDVDLIDRVEIVRGPSSSLYGANAFFGIINVITKRGRDLQGIETSAAAGSQDTYRGRLSFGNRSSAGLEALISGSWHESQGDEDIFFAEYDDPATNNGLAEDVDKDQFKSFFGQFSLYDFTLEGAWVEREKINPTGAYGTVFNHPGNRGNVEQGYATLTWRHYFSKQGELLLRASYDRYISDSDFVYDYSLPSLVVNKDEFRGERWGAEARFSRQVGERHKVIVGGEFQDNFRQDQKNYDLSVYLDAQNNSDNWGMYLQDEILLHEKVRATAGIRYDYYDTFGETTNPRLALIYQPRDRTSLKLLYGTAFRAPSAFEFYYHDGFATQKPNPDLDPEEIETWELVWEELLNSQWRSVLSVFHYEIEDLIDFRLDPSDGLLTFDNLKEVEADGFEIELERQWDSGVEGRLSYSFQQVEDKSSGERLSNSPRHLAKLNLAAPLIRDKLFLGVEEQFTGERKTRSGDKEESYFITNMTLSSRELMAGLKLSGSIYNLFDRKYGNPVSGAHRQETMESNGRLFRVKATWTF